VTYADGRLEVAADNSSLNQVLREISRKTGMKITGGIGDERVFGTYGPGPPGEILASLLDGTGSNMLLRESSTDAPDELILTPREGGPTPPNPNAPGYDDDQPDQPAATPQWVTPGATPPGPGSSSNPAAASSGQLPMASGADAAPAASGANSQPTGDVPQSPNGVKTPAQLYQQLQQLQQQQQQPANPQSPAIGGE
jgi:hypothetical protein